MQEDLSQIYKEILRRISPSEEEKAKIESLAKELERRVSLACEEQGIKASVRVEGSVAKGTWLREDPDVDVFMRLPLSIPRKALGDISLKIARKATEGSKQIERFAEHPYLEAFVDGTRVNIVPCYDVKRGEWLSATDRTPFHTDYVKERIDVTLRNEVLLLKKFLKGIKVYGAEIKTGGFSGYLCELLILHYRSFGEALQAFNECTRRKVIDIENYYAGRQRELQLLFAEPLIIIDPIDKGRNVASAVQPQKLCTFVGAARAFLKAPSVRFFDPPKTKALSSKKLSFELDNRGSSIIFLTFGAVEAVPDVMWGQLYKTQRALRKLLELGGFNVLRDSVWSDEKALTVFALELDQTVLPKVRKHLGPPLEKEKESGDFLAKYAQNIDVVSGPYLEDGRWVVELDRKLIDAVGFLQVKLKEGGRDVGVAEMISNAFKTEFEILVNSKVAPILKNNREFSGFLTDFLLGKPFWLLP